MRERERDRERFGSLTFSSRENLERERESPNVEIVIASALRFFDKHDMYDIWCSDADDHTSVCIHSHIVLTHSSRRWDGDCDGILHHDVRRGVDVFCVSGYV